MKLFSKNDSYLGIDLGAGGIKLVELKKTKNRPQLWTYGILNRQFNIHPTIEQEYLGDKSPEQLLGKVINPQQKVGQKKKAPVGPVFEEAQINEFADALKQLVQQTKATSKRVTASLPVSQVFHAVVTLPKIDEKEADHHIKAKVKKILPHSLDDMQVVHQRIPDESENPRDMKFLVTAAPKTLVAFYSAIFQKAGLQLEELETEAFALERSLVGNDKGTVMVVDVGAERTNFFIIDKGLPFTHRSIRFGGNILDEHLQDMLGVSLDEVKKVKKDISNIFPTDKIIDRFTPLIDPLMKEIDYSFDLYSHQIGNEGQKLEKIILTGGSSVFPAIQAYITKQSQSKVFVGDPWARVVYQQGLKSVLDNVAPRMSVAIGLAMRNIVE